MTTRRSRVLGLALLFLLGVRAAEASLLSERYVASWAPAGFFPLSAFAVQVRGIQNEAGARASFDYAAYLAAQVRQRLSASAVSIVESGGAHAVAVQITIHLYQEGSAFGRWLLPGAGATYAVVRAELRKPGQAVGADLLAVSVIRSGGVYSIGGEKAVLDDVADEIVAFVRAGGGK